MEQKLGRYLKPAEEIHHIDGDKANNDIRNLHLFKDKIAHTKWHNRLREIAIYD